mgnify:CR=1 FL=1
MSKGEALGLIDGSRDPGVWGEIVWDRRSTSYNGCVSGQTIDEATVTLAITVRLKRPWEPTVLYRCGTITWRIDHNSAHRGRLFTHLQVEDKDDPAWAGSFVRDLGDVGLFSPIVGEAPSGSELEATLRSSASYLHVNVDGVTWIDPPEGVQ